MSTGENIQRIRKSRNFTQADLAKRANLSEISIRKYESGDRNPKLEAIRSIAAALEVPICDLKPDWKSFSHEEIVKDFEGLPLHELRILQDYRILNETGQDEARKRVNELTEIKKYTEKD